MLLMQHRAPHMNPKNLHFLLPETSCTCLQQHRDKLGEFYTGFKWLCSPGLLCMELGCFCSDLPS